MSRRLACWLLLATPLRAPDPGGSWLSYAVYNANPKDIITRMKCSMMVPGWPRDPSGDTEAALWFGVQTSDGDGTLVQPIMAKWMGGHFAAFHEIYDFNSHKDYVSSSLVVGPGEVITASITYRASNRSYDMELSVFPSNQSVVFNYGLSPAQSHNESTAYLVLEHEPDRCAQLPGNVLSPGAIVGKSTFHDVAIEVNGEPVASPVWKTRPGPFCSNPKYKCCGSTARATSPTEIEIQWNVSDHPSAQHSLAPGSRQDKARR